MTPAAATLQALNKCSSWCKTKGKRQLPMVRSVSVDNLIQQLSFFSKNRNLENGIPYEELEMGLPGSISAVNQDATEGWDQDWDDDDWGEGSVVKSPVRQHIRSVSMDGLTSRSSTNDG